MTDDPPPANTLQESEHVFMAHVVHVARRYRGKLDAQLRSLGCGTAALETMAAIASSRHPLTQTEIANGMGIESATLTRMLGLLERRGWISRERAADDGRAKLIALTGEGKTQLKKMNKVVDKFCHSTLENLSDTSLVSITALYEKVFENLAALE